MMPPGKSPDFFPQRILPMLPIGMKKGHRRGPTTTVVNDDSTKGPKGIDELSHKIDKLAHVVNSFLSPL